FLLLHTKNYSLLLPAAQAAERFYRKNEQPKQQFEVELPIALLLQKDRDYRDPEVLKQVMAEASRSEEHTSELQSRENLVCRLLLRPSPRPPPVPYTTLFRSFLLLHTKNYSLLLPAAQAAERFYRKNEQPKQQFEVELPIALLLQKDRDYRDPEVLKQVMAEAS